MLHGQKRNYNFQEVKVSMKGSAYTLAVPELNDGRCFMDERGTATFKKLKEKYWRPEIYKDVAYFVGTSKSCLIHIQHS